jgi:hypothetical protein
MEYLKEQTDELKRYCGKVSALPEGGITFFYLEGLRLPAGCDPAVCDALLCPVARDGYPSRLYFSANIKSSYTRNWNVTGARICEKNWFAFSWRVDIQGPTLAQALLAHLIGFTKEK